MLKIFSFITWTLTVVTTTWQNNQNTVQSFAFQQRQHLKNSFSSHYHKVSSSPHISSSSSSSPPLPSSFFFPRDLKRNNIIVVQSSSSSSSDDDDDAAAAPALPKVAISYCTGCRWMLRAAWLAQELLTTFEGDLHSVSLVPGRPEAPGGTFIVSVDGKIVWDRKEEGRHVEAKELKQRIRDIINPDRDLGHSDVVSKS